MSYIAYRNLLYVISETLDNSYDINRLRFMCGVRIPRENRDNINNASQLFDELEDHNHLGIDNLYELKEILRELGELRLLRVVIQFEIRRNELREPPQDAALLDRRPVGVVNLKTYIMIAGVGAVAGAAFYSFCTRTPTFFGDFARHVVDGITLIDVTRGSLCFTVQAENLLALKALWDMYQDGALQKSLQEFLVTEEIKKLADGKEVEVTVSIDEQEYKDACLDLKIAEMEASRNKELPFTARRRNSDSSVSLKYMETEAMRIKLNQSQKKLQLERKRTRALEKEIDNSRAKLVATRRVGIQTTEPTKETTVGAQNWKEAEEAMRIELREAQKELDLERKRTLDQEETIENLHKKLRMGPTWEDTAVSDIAEDRGDKTVVFLSPDRTDHHQDKFFLTYCPAGFVIY